MSIRKNGKVILIGFTKRKENYEIYKKHFMQIGKSDDYQRAV
jgi:hypothetical protein